MSKCNLYISEAQIHLVLIIFLVWRNIYLLYVKVFYNMLLHKMWMRKKKYIKKQIKFKVIEYTATKGNF